MHLAAHHAGLEVVYAYEPDAPARDIYAANTGLTPDNTPSESYTFDHVPPFQLLIAGLPEGGDVGGRFRVRVALPEGPATSSRRVARATGDRP